MTLTVTQVTDWLFAQSAADRIQADIAAVRRKYEGKAAVEHLPNGKDVNVRIVHIDWESSYVTLNKYGELEQGGWAVQVEVLEGDCKGMKTWTSDRVLKFEK